MTNGAENARSLDEHDELARFRNEFVVTDPSAIYLDGNSLGRLPKRAAERMRQVVEREWGDRLIRGWNEGWFNASKKMGAKIAQLIGANPEEVLVADSTSVNLFKLSLAAIRSRPGRSKVVS